MKKKAKECELSVDKLNILYKYLHSSSVCQKNDKKRDVHEIFTSKARAVLSYALGTLFCMALAYTGPFWRFGRGVG